MPRGDSLHLQILGRVAGQLKHLSGEVLQDGRAVDSRGGSPCQRRMPCSSDDDGSFR